MFEFNFEQIFIGFNISQDVYGKPFMDTYLARTDRTLRYECVTMKTNSFRI